MKTYVEERNEKPFDWNAFLAKENYWPAELLNAMSLAGSWITCACGNQCSVIPRFKEGQPEDELLERLGTDFHREISGMRYARIEHDGALSLDTKVEQMERFERKRQFAIRTLHNIESRSQELIFEYHKTRIL